MAKVKKISINAFEGVVKENFENTVTKEWFGIPVTITKTISFEDVVNFVAEVADNCFLGDGRYIPEAMHALINCGVVRHYTNINLPSSLSAAYELVMRSGIIDFVMPEINSDQYSDIIIAIRDKIEYACDTDVTEFRNSLLDMMASVTDLQEKTKELFGKISPDEIQTLLAAFGDDKAVENKVVDAYIERQKADLKIVGDN
jgi:hypothetical protein